MGKAEANRESVSRDPRAALFLAVPCLGSFGFLFVVTVLKHVAGEPWAGDRTALAAAVFSGMLFAGSGVVAWRAYRSTRAVHPPAVAWSVVAAGALAVPAMMILYWLFGLALGLR